MSLLQSGIYAATVDVYDRYRLIMRLIWSCEGIRSCGLVVDRCFREIGRLLENHRILAARRFLVRTQRGLQNCPEKGGGEHDE